MTRLVKSRWRSVVLSLAWPLLANAPTMLLAQETVPPLSVPTLNAPPAEDPSPADSNAPLSVPPAPGLLPPLPPMPIEMVPQKSQPYLSPPIPNGQMPTEIIDPNGATTVSMAPPPIMFRASDILRPDIVRGANYEINEKVTLDRYRFVFDIKTTWGNVEAHGMPMLELRLGEIRAIQRAKIISRDPQFVDGVLHAIKMTPKGALVVISEPVSTVRRFPEGFKRIYHTRYNEFDKRAGCDVRRRVAVEIGCDPETTNPILIPLLDEMAKKKGAGSIAAQVGMNFGLQGISALPVAAQFKESLATKLPHEIHPEIEKELISLGVSPETSSRFVLAQQFTTTQKLIFLFYLRRLPGEHRAALVEGAVDTTTEAEAIGSVHELKLILDASRSLQPVRYEYLGLPVAILKDGMNMIITSADYIHASPDLDQMVAAYRRSYPGRPAILYTSGRVTPEAQDIFRTAGIQVLQR